MSIRWTSTRSRRSACCSRSNAATWRGGAGGDRAGRPVAVPPRALHGDAAARHRQGPRRRPFGTRRPHRHRARPQARPDAGGDRDRLLAGAAPPAGQPDRLQARHRRPQDHPRHRRPGAVAGTPAAAAGADGLRHAGGGPKVWNGWKATLLREVYWRVAEVLAGGLSVPERDVRVARARDAAAAMLAGWSNADAGNSWSSAIPATGCPSMPKRMPATPPWSARRSRPRRR